MAGFSKFLVVTSDGISLCTFLQELSLDLKTRNIKGKVETEIILKGGHKIRFNLVVPKLKSSKFRHAQKD